MNSSSQLRECASEVVDAARRFEAAAQVPNSYPGAPDSLEALEEAFQLLSAAWYRLAADASPDLAARRRAGLQDGAGAHADGLSREHEVRVLATLHDIAAGFARTARACRTGRAKVAPIIERGLAATRRSWPREHEQAERQVA